MKSWTRAWGGWEGRYHTGLARKAVLLRWHRSGGLNEKEQLNKECREEHLEGGNSQHGGSESTLFGI